MEQDGWYSGMAFGLEKYSVYHFVGEIHVFYGSQDVRGTRDCALNGTYKLVMIYPE